MAIYIKVVDEQQCPNAPETVVISSPAEISELAAKWRLLLAEKSPLFLFSSLKFHGKEAD